MALGCESAFGPSQVGLRRQSPAFAKPLANAAYRRHTVTQRHGNLMGGFAMLVEVNNPSSNRQGDSFHAQGLLFCT